MTAAFVVSLFVVGFGLNLVWEFSHAILYETCRRQTWRQNVPLLIVMSLKDALWIVLFYTVSVLMVGADHFWWVLVFFAALAFSFSYIDERVSLHLGRWEYARAMPLVFGVGLTPLLEIAVTGFVALWVVF